MELLAGIVLGIIVLTLIVVAHEFGHAIVARRNGVVVEEFGIGFPPRAWARTLKNGVVFSLNWLPLGGFVKLQGEHDSSRGKGDYGAVSLWKKAKILLAGVVVNWLIGALLLTILALIGLPKILPGQFTMASDSTVLRQPVRVASVVKGLPAEKSGLEKGDTIVSLNGLPVTTAADVSRLTSELSGMTVPVVYMRAGVEHTMPVSLRAANNDKKGYLGASVAQQEFLRSTWSAPIVGVGTAAQMTWVTLQGLGDVIGKGVSGLVLQLSPDAKTRQSAQQSLSVVGDSVAGPVGIFGVIFPAAEQAGPRQVLLLSAIISLTLAIMNCLPIPALDGGRLAVTILFRLFKKPLSQNVEERIHGTGFMLLMLLVVIITIADIGKLHP